MRRLLSLGHLSFRIWSWQLGVINHWLRRQIDKKKMSYNLFFNMNLLNRDWLKRFYVRKSFCRSGSQTLFFGEREATTGNASALRRLNEASKRANDQIKILWRMNCRNHSARRWQYSCHSPTIHRQFKWLVKKKIELINWPDFVFSFVDKRSG